ncbi:hypothetical protein KTR10_03100 [Candidatus Kaiserbacteria bacterium]|nr:hypothetical protein [Candidatus Kaiserbacteria bacterium]
MKANDICADEEAYGEHCKAHLLRQYELYVDEVDKLNDRRQKTNDFFLAINTAIIAFLGIMIRFGDENFTTYLVLTSLAGVAICVLWYSLIRNYSIVSGARFQILHLIEEKLPIQLFKKEWELLTSGVQGKQYMPITHIERNVPWVFIILYILLLTFQGEVLVFLL